MAKKNYFTIEGVIHSVKPEQIISEKFKKQTVKVQVVFESNGSQNQFVKNIPFDFVNEKITELSDITIGDKVKVNFNINNREWTNKDGIIVDFLTLNAFKLTFVEKNSNNMQESGESQMKLDNQEEDDLPF